ncbi:MAG: transposase [Pirellulales bacterium]
MKWKIAVLVAIGVDQEGYCQVLGVMEGIKEDKESWRGFLRHLKERGLKGVQLVTSDKCLGLVEVLGEFYLEAAWQRCMFHWYRNEASQVPKTETKGVMAMLKAIHAQEDRDVAEKKAVDVVAKLRKQKLTKAAQCIEEGVSETLIYMVFLRELLDTDPDEQSAGGRFVNRKLVSWFGFLPGAKGAYNFRDFQ